MNQQLTTELENAGWYPGRVVDVQSDLEAYRAEGYEIWDGLADALREYSGLSISGPANNHPVIIGAEPAIRSIGAEDVPGYAALAKARLTPIAVYYAMTIFMSPDGRFWGGHGDLFGFLSAEITDVLDSILNQPGSNSLDMIVED